MTNKSEVMRRADRVLVFALTVAVATIAGAASSGIEADVAKSGAVHPYTVQSREALAGALGVAQHEAQPVPVLVNAIAAAPSAAELAMVRIAAEQRCLAEAMYFEARGEGSEGEEAIAEVIFHRMHSRYYPGSICGVVFQGAGSGSGCQFSFACNGEMERRKTPGAWAHANLLAAQILSGYLRLGNATNGATSFHAVDVEPDWSSSLERTVQIGNHVFYRPLGHTHAS